MQSILSKCLKGLAVITVFSLVGCQSQSINTNQEALIALEISENSKFEQENTPQPKINVVVEQDPDLSLAAASQIAGPESEINSEELASIPQIDAADIKIVVEEPILNIWQRVRSKMVLDIPTNRRIKVQRDWYEKHQAYLDRVITRATPFLHLIVEEIEKRNMPMELVLLPIVESAYDPFAYSHGRASGMWQFIPGTGLRFKLKQNWWYDGRRDVVESTRAALDYMSYLHKHFDGDWLHALAAYNSGEGNVGRAIRRNKKKNKKTDFWNLKLPRETQAYVPKLLALAELLAKEETFSLKWKEVANEPVLVKVETDGQLDIAFAAKLADITVDDFYKLNPGFNRWSTPPNGPRHLLLPLNKADGFKAKLAASDPADRVRWVRYKVKSGDSLIRIANNHNTTPATLKSVNKIRGNMIRAGDKLLIPTASQSASKYSLSSDSRLDARQKIQRGDNKVNYKVRSGDSFWKIAQQYKVSLRKLAAWNGMAPRDPLKIGQKLVIWTKQPITAVNNRGVALTESNRLRKISYRVRKGDSLARISNKFAVKIGDLKRWNNAIKDKKYLQPGDRLTVYVDITSQSGS
ncbi:MAG: membrane-bound lytic murein transglycosylase D [Enterobacterales bacterium]